MTSATGRVLDASTGVTQPGDALRPTIVFVHGAWHGPWCWTAWVDVARREGFPTASPTLPGHQRPGDRARKWSLLGSYLRHLRAVVEAIDGPVVVVGHSMGGHLTQRLLAESPSNVVGGVLVASVPRRGATGAMSRMIRHDPRGTLRATVRADLARIFATPADTRHWFFSPTTTEDVVSDTHDRLQNVSIFAASELNLRWTHPRRVRVPVMVLAAEGDAIFSARSQRRLAKAYGTTAQFVPGGHDAMLDVGANGALHLVLDWVRRLPGQG